MVKIYYADISLVEDKQIFDYLFEKMNMQRRTKILRCKNKEDKMRSLLAGYLLRIALEEEGYSYENLEFSMTKEGKPILLSYPGLYFNMSHGGKFAVCALSNQMVGVDIESENRLLFQDEKEDRLEKVAERSLTPEEKKIFSKCERAEKKISFLKYWTRKESYSKAIGKGLGMDFNSINTISIESRYWSDWIEEGYYLSIYKEDGEFSSLQVKKVVSI